MHYLNTLKLAGKLHQRFLDALKSELARAGFRNLNPAQCFILLHVQDGVSIRELRDRCVDGDRNISYNIDHLAKKGLISKQKSDTDQRSVEVALTEAGRMAQEAAQDALVGAACGDSRRKHPAAKRYGNRPEPNRCEPAGTRGCGRRR